MPARLGNFPHLRLRVLEAGLAHVAQQPAAVVLVAAALRKTDRAQPVLGVELVDADSTQRRVGQHFDHVDEVLVVLDPEPGAELLGHQPGDGLGAYALRELLRGRRDEFADDECDHREQDADAGERRREARGRHAGSPHHRVLRAGHHLGQREQRADQRRRREQGVDPVGHLEQHVGHDPAQRVVAAPEILDLLDQVEEREQHHQGDEHQGGGHDDFGRQVKPQRSHGVLMARSGTARTRRGAGRRARPGLPASRRAPRACPRQTRAAPARWKPG